MVARAAVGVAVHAVQVAVIEPAKGIALGARAFDERRFTGQVWVATSDHAVRPLRVIPGTIMNVDDAPR